jgi:CO/xanthine dehydrogenase FAD-binding subunit
VVKSFRPDTYLEALQIIDAEKAVPYAGGTDWMVRKNSESNLIFLNHLQALKVVQEEDENLYIGAVCTYKELLSLESIPPVLKMAIKEIASPAIRNAGTIGGNLCNASPAGDTLPVLYALQANVKLTSVYSSRVIKIQDFILGPKRTDIRPNEILECIIVPKQSFNKVYYQKVGARKADAISKLSFVGLMQIREGIIEEIRIAMGAVGPTVVKSSEIEQQYKGISLQEVLHERKEFLDRYEAIIQPIDDQRSTALYRKKTSLKLLEDFLVTSSL